MRFNTETVTRAMVFAVRKERSAWIRRTRILTGLIPVTLLALAVSSATLSAQSVRAPVNLGTAGNYVVLSQTGITDVPPTAIVGNIAASPVTGAAIHVTCAEVTGTITSVDAAGPAPCNIINPVALTTAIGDMGTAYTDAAGRTIPDFVNLGAGNISGLTLVPGLYKWSTSVLADATGFTLSGGPNAVWIFQVAGDVSVANGAHMVLAGGAQANNIFWQVAGATGVTLGTTTQFSGTILSSKQVILNTGSTFVGRALAGTQVTLQSNSITTPGPLVGGIPAPVAPTVTSTAPFNLAASVPTGTLITAAFSEAMTPASINGVSFKVNNGLTAIAGTVSYTGVTATFTPTSSLPPSTLLTATITTAATDLAGNPLAANYVWTFSTGGAADLTPPTVSSTFPVSNAANVPVGNALSATFSESMNPFTINTTTFNLRQGATPVAGSVLFIGLTVTFTPTSSLAANLPFTATITTGVTDLAGNAMAANYSWNFTTGATPDKTPPTVISTVPLNNATNVPVGSSLLVTFSEPMNPLTVTTATFSLKQSGLPVLGNVIYTGLTATFTPLSALTANTPFIATISSGATDLAGNALGANYVWSFNTGAVADTTPPFVTSTTPPSNSSQATTTANLSATFSKPMNPLTITTATFLLKAGTTSISGAVTYTGSTATFRPTNALAPNTQYTATVTNVAADLAGNVLAANYSWNFSTGTAAGQPDLCLVNLAVIAGSAVINVGSTKVTGDIGVSPGTIISGFPPGTFTGFLHAGDAVAAQAMADVTAAYADAVSRSLQTVQISGDLGGQTLTPGLYQSLSSLAISSGDLTLDAKGDPKAVFIFQVASTLTTSGGRQIVMANGGQAFNVFWQVGTSATLGAGSTFNGSILANQSITLGTGAAVFGRIASITGTVTLQGNTITSPPPFVLQSGIVNAASENTTVAAGSIASVFGNNFGSSLNVVSTYLLPGTLGGVSFQIGAQTAPLFMTSCGQANVQIPWESAGQTTLPISASAGGLVSGQQTVNIAPFAPGIFSLNQVGSGQGAIEIAPTAQLAAAAPLGNPVTAGQYIAIFATGLGAVTNQPADGAPGLANPLSTTLTLPVVQIGNVQAQVTYSGLAPSFAGLYQVNAIVPAGVVPGVSVPVTITIGGVQSNTVTIAVQ